MKLFEEKKRTDLAPSKHIDNTFDFYDRSAQINFKIIRNTLNSWFEKYPKSEQKELKNRFKTEFSSAFFELFLHELFHKQGFSLSPHPSLADTNKKPDFLVKGNGIEFYVEAIEATGKSDEERAHENWAKILYDSINTINSPNFLLGLNELFFKTTNQPKVAKIVRYIESKLPDYDPDTYNNDNAEPIICEDENLRLEISLIPRQLKYRGKEGNQAIGVYPGESFFGGVEDVIKLAVKKKATRYGKLDKPYLVCINSTSEKGTDEFAIMNALFGSLKCTFSTNPANRNEKWERSFDGIFRDSKGAKFTRVSGLLITSVFPANLHVANYWLVKHPFSVNDLAFENFQLSKIIVEGGQIKKMEGKTIKDVLEILDNWIDI